MGLLDKLLAAPGQLAEKTAEGLTRLPGVPLDVADKALDGAAKGMDKLTDPKARRP